jgi:serine/threonine-protein kinase
MEDESAKRRIGAVLSGGRYRVEDLLGTGGMATVYRGRHRNGNPVAIKILHPQFGLMRDIAARFLKEGYVANAVEHPGTVRVLDDDVAEDGAPYLVMDLLEGKTLDQLRRASATGALPVREVLGYAEDLLSVLQAAHEKGIVHRDIKPDNVFVTTEGKLKVLDFGIARVLTGPSATNTRTGNILGTPAYLPPEQALGLTKEIDGRTDQWAVGAMLFKLLSGKYVHEGETPEHVVVLTASRPARSLATVAPHLPADVIALVDRALAFEKPNRFPDANAMRKAVRAHLDGAGSDDLRFEKTQPLPGAAGASPARSPSVGPTNPLASSIARPLSEPAAEGGILTSGQGRDSVANTASAVASTNSGSTASSKRSRAVLGVVGILAILGPAAWYVQRTTTAGSTTPVPESAAPPLGASLDPPVRDAASAVSTSMPSAIAIQSAASASVPAPVQSASSAPGGTTVRPVHAASAKPGASARPPTSASAQAPAAPAKPNCDPPFIVDPESGARKVKPGC